MDGEDRGVEIFPLYYWGEPTEQQRIALRKGKELLGVDWLVQPIAVKRSGESPDLPVLCFEDPPYPFLSGYARLTPPYTAPRMAAALEEIYQHGEHLSRPEEWLSVTLGTTVSFLEEVNDDE